MYRLGKYNAGDRMSDLVCANYPILLVMSRFGIALGFGDKTIGQVCEESRVDTDTFLTVVNLLLEEDHPVSAGDYVFSIDALVCYLHNSHDYFLGFRLPAIRCKLVEAIDCRSDVAQAILRYYDQYVEEVEKHMKYEERVVFPYVRALLDGGDDGGYSIEIFRSRHDQVEARLNELKNIIIKYYPADSGNELNSVLFDIFTCAQDLASHNYIEDYLFVPSIVELERQKRGYR